MHLLVQDTRFLMVDAIKIYLGEKMKYLISLIILMSFLLISCEDDIVKDKCTTETCTQEYKECREDQCILKENSCENNNDCEDKICDNHKCVEKDLCKDIVCDSWKECNSTNGVCELKTDMCDKNGDCIGQDVYCEPTTHECKLKDPCENETCSNHGFCAVTNENKPICSCQTGYHINPENSLECIKDVAPLCKDVICSNHGDCSIINNGAICDCDIGYHAQDLNCVKDSNPCDGVSCSDHGICAIVNGDEALCSCNPGYHPNPENALDCIIDVIDLCANPNCDEWRECNPENGVCELKTGRCGTTDDCSGDNACNNQHICENPCTNVNCSNHGSCSVVNSTAICSCEDSYRVTDDKKFCLWNGYQWTNIIDTLYTSDMTLDNDGNIYMLGKFEGRVDFNPGIETDYKTSSPSYEENIYLTKYRADGSYEWTKVFFPNYDNYQAVYSVIVDDQKNIYISYSNYYHVSGADTSYDHFKIAKLSPAGNQIWEKNIDSDLSITKMAFDRDQNNIILVGNFRDTFEFNSHTYDPDGTDIVVLKYGLDGTFKWIQTVGTVWHDDYTRDLIVDNLDKIYIVGSMDYFNGFIIKLDTDSSLIWSKIISGGESSINSIKVSNDNIYVLGEFKESVDFNFGDGEDIYTSNGEEDVFILKLTKNGSFVWVKTYGGTGSDIGYELAINENSLYLVGIYSDTITFDANMDISGTSNGEEDIFLLTLDNNGAYLDSQVFGGAQEEYIYNMVYDNDSLYINGSFRGTVDFDPSVWNVNISSQDTKDIFTWKYTPEF